MSTAAKVVLWIVGSVVMLVLLGTGVLWWGLSGGWDGIRPAAQPEDADVVEAREGGVEPLDRLAGPVEQELSRAARPLGTEPVDRCSAGQNNWKVEDGWTLQCTQARVTGTEAPSASVSAASNEVDARLQALGWVPVSYREMELLPAGDRAEARYEHPDDPDAGLVVEVSAAGRARPHVSLGRYGSSWSGSGDEQAVLDAVETSSEVTVLAVVRRTYFQDD